MTLAQRTLLSSLVQRGLAEDVLARAIETAERTSRSLTTVLVDDQIVTEFELASAAGRGLRHRGRRPHQLPGRPVGDVGAAAGPGPPAPDAAHRGEPDHGDRGPARPGRRARPRRHPGRDRPDRAPGRGGPRRATQGCWTATPARSTDLDEAAAADRGRRDQSPATSRSSPATTTPRSCGTSTRSIEQAISSRASDIHLEPTERDLRVRLSHRRRAARGRHGAAGASSRR